MLCLLFVPTALILSYYSGLALRVSVDDQNHNWTLALTEYVFMAEGEVCNVRDGACSSYYTYNRRLDNIGGSLLFRFPRKVLYTLKFFCLYKPARRIATDPVSTALAFHMCGEVDCDKTAVSDGILSYDFPTDEANGHSKEVILAKKRVKGVDGVPMTVTPAAVSVAFRADVSHVDFASIKQVYDAHGQREGDGGEAELAGASERVDLDALVEKDVLWNEATDAKNDTEEA